ncbi:MAG: response regulator [Candidatus Peribacteraceae bacterium]|nr:response regulator [Candidatus Peribacteraceae bacterium]
MKRVLIAEDESFIAELYKTNLESAGISTGIAHDGEEAVNMIKKSKPELLLLDLLMPKMDGFAVLEWLKENKKKGNPLPVIIVTNLSQKLSQKRCEELGVADYIVKSDVGIDEILTIVKKYLKKK